MIEYYMGILGDFSPYFLGEVYTKYSFEGTVGLN